MDIYIYNIDNTICATCATCKHPVVHESIHESIYFSVPEAVLLMSRKSETSKVSTRLSPTLVKTDLEPAKYAWIGFWKTPLRVFALRNLQCHTTKP